MIGEIYSTIYIPQKDSLLISHSYGNSTVHEIKKKPYMKEDDLVTITPALRKYLENNKVDRLSEKVIRDIIGEPATYAPQKVERKKVNLPGEIKVNLLERMLENIEGVEVTDRIAHDRKVMYDGAAFPLYGGSSGRDVTQSSNLLALINKMVSHEISKGVVREEDRQNRVNLFFNKAVELF